jgi:hypothetical protein
VRGDTNRHALARAPNLSAGSSPSKENVTSVGLHSRVLRPAEATQRRQPATSSQNH